MKKTKRSGLTLVEVMVAAAMVSIVLFATAIMLVFSQKSWNRNLQQATLQRDASVAMLKIKQAIRNGTGAQLDADSLGVTINHTSGSIRYWYVGSQKTMKYQIAGQAAETLLSGNVSNATFAIDSTTHKTVTVVIELVNGDSQTEISSTTLMRNYPSGT